MLASPRTGPFIGGGMPSWFLRGQALRARIEMLAALPGQVSLRLLVRARTGAARSGWNASILVGSENVPDTGTGVVSLGYHPTSDGFFCCHSVLIPSTRTGAARRLYF